MMATDMASVLQLPKAPVEIAQYEAESLDQQIIPVSNDFGENPGPVQYIIDHCGFIRHCRDGSATLPEKHWHAMISNLALSKDSDLMIHVFSKDYPYVLVSLPVNTLLN